ncbi:NAD(P)H-binding protein [Actinomadura rupiterrae]|uniref:NAD(P)H-binding protein n=1 Tax=Actinomadura rupiterrae TaxID=559627 RepID=UPI0020A33089|nr:NAD(P)H-binding protein [Actinomadura rupiterrae]MCP2342739.1 uncharacterized protein YbjT (DUF2867 family) [Actinomadura rupiterrae]
MKVLVIGATGKTGRAVMDALTARGAEALAAIRNPSPDGVRFDWADRTTWKPALEGADALYIVGPYAQPDADVLLRDLLATATNVRRIVLLSVIGADKLPSIVPMAGWERDVQNSGKEWTILRPNWFQQNFAEGFLPALQNGTLELPAGDAAVSFVDTRDIAEVAAIALTSDGHSGQTYELTGPEALTHTEALEILSKVADRDLRYVPLDPSAHTEAMRAAGAPERTITWQAALFSQIRDGSDATITNTIERLTAHPARTFTAFATEHAPTWQSA